MSDLLQDPWHRTMGLNMRAEPAKFTLSAFHLDVDKAQFAERLARFLANEPLAGVALEHRRFIVLRVPNPAADVSLCEFSATGELERIVPVFDQRIPVPESAVREAVGAVLDSYRETRPLSESRRPRQLARLANRRCGALAKAVAHRILTSTVVSFEDALPTSSGQFAPPDFRLRRGFGGGCFNLVGRASPGGSGLDIWLQCHHAGTDAAPVQEMLTRLEQEWGVTAPVTFPPAGSRHELEAHLAGERPAGMVIAFLDFAPLMEARRQYRSRTGRNVAIAAMLIWALSRQSEFAGAGISTAVDLPASDRWPRAVDLVALWPHRYGPDGFAAFSKDFDELVATARRRQTRSWKAMTMLTSLPPLLSCAILLDQNGTRNKFGTLTVSIVKGARIIVPPLPDSAWDHGFITVGSIGIPARTGPPVTAVSFKADPGRIRGGVAAFQRAIEAAGEYFR